MSDPQSQEPFLSDSKTPYIDAEKGTKSDSYIAATDRVNREEPVAYTKDVDAVQVQSPPQTIGLTKEELEQYRDDPFWKKMRIILFILFWVAWIAMFVAAIIIVVTSPKCDPKISPHWWQTKVCYQTWTTRFQDSNSDGVGDLRGFMDRLDLLRRIGVQTIRPIPLLQTPDKGDDDVYSIGGYDVTDFKQIDKRIGTNEEFKELIDMTHDKDMYLVMDLPISVTSIEHPWYKEARGMYTDLSVDKYPQMKVLNWDNNYVINNMTEIIKFWLDQGVDGFYLGFVEYLARKGGQPDWPEINKILADIRNEVNNYRNGTNEKDREFLLFTSTTDSITEDTKVSLSTDGQLNFVINKQLTTLDNKSCPDLAKCIHDKLTPVLKMHEEKKDDSYPMWEIGSPYVSRASTRLGSRAKSELMQILLLTLPGAINTYYGDEIGMTDNQELEAKFVQRTAMQWIADKPNAGFSDAAEDKVKVNEDYKTYNFDSQYYSPMTTVKMYKRLSMMRQTDETMMKGEFKLGKADQAPLLTFTRYKEGNVSIPFMERFEPGHTFYFGALNFGDKDVEVTFDQDILPIKEPSQALVVTLSSSLGARDHYFPRQKIDLTEDKLKLGPEDGIILKFTI